ncbi:MAG TPA: hypothetical protein VGO07_00650, partial [Candidatus Saccharimonadales bacterium]|nr:hypothetical protein [Candidatus Saccharimonadales bacterium]
MAKETPTKKKNKKAAAKSSAKTNSVKSVAKSVTPEVVKSTSAAAVKPARVSTPVSKLARWYKWLGLAFFAEGLVVVLMNKAVTAPITVQYP